MAFNEAAFLELERRGKAPEDLVPVVEELRKRGKFPTALTTTANIPLEAETLGVSIPEPRVEGPIAKVEELPIEEPKTPKKEQEESISIADTAIQAVLNTPESAARFGEGFITAFFNPVKTATNLRDLTFGTMAALGLADLPEEETLANKVFDAYKKRYGGFENIKKTIATDPVGFLADAATLLGGVGGLTKVAGKITGVSKLTKTGAALTKAGLGLEPVRITGKLLKPFGQVGKKIMGNVLTGVGGEFVEAATKPQSRVDFLEALRGDISFEGLIDKTKGVIDDVAELQTADYTSRLDKIGQVTKTFGDELNTIRSDFFKLISDKKGFRVTLDEASPNLIGPDSFKSSSFASESFIKDVTEVADDLINWERRRPDNIKALGMDALKRHINNKFSGTKESRAITTAVSNKIKDVLIDNVPGYENMIKSYAEFETLIKNAKSALGTQNNKLANATVKKMSNLLKEDNVFSRQVLDRIEKLTGKQIIPTLAGLSARPFTAQATVGRRVQEASVIIGLMGNVDAKLAMVAMMASPRIAAEFFNALGIAARGYQKLQKGVGVSIPSAISRAGEIQGLELQQQEQLAPLE